MAIDISSIQIFSDSDLLILTRKAIADVMAGGQAYGQNGKTFTRADLPELWNTVTMLETRIQDDANLASGEGGNVAVATFDPPT